MRVAPEGRRSDARLTQLSAVGSRLTAAEIVSAPGIGRKTTTVSLHSARKKCFPTEWASHNSDS